MQVLLVLLTAVPAFAQQLPVISSFSPGSAPVGTVVTINGSQLDSPTSLTVGGTAPIILSASSSQIITAYVMPASVTGHLNGQQRSSGKQLRRLSQQRHLPWFSQWYHQHNSRTGFDYTGP
ncbi:IPT/TIG domain-containing protein [Mucilaginibacter sp. PPCGB 2223]|uniref:IPT/TIG domain-containing protein n=1 Tax=Mucilaginibacter sp. PPCGB 2223 TaxID=1886027 RepID=UPI0008245B39|nr:IPT/TIG domain-containing protein [Mucilaginibacter sp. PPCGB 2223]